MLAAAAEDAYRDGVVLPIESIRHPLEDELTDVIVERFGPFKLPDDDDGSVERLEMTALELESGSRPYALLQRAVDVLELPGRFRLFQTSGKEWNAHIHCSRTVPSSL
ncbi:MAG: hypothetical protein AAGH15_01700 [Myxococcota bacterium]